MAISFHNDRFATLIHNSESWLPMNVISFKGTDLLYNLKTCLFFVLYTHTLCDVYQKFEHNSIFLKFVSWYLIMFCHLFSPDNNGGPRKSMGGSRIRINVTKLTV